MDNETTVAVFGATGAQGAPVVTHALQRGLKVRAIARDTKKIEALHPQAEAFAATLDDEEAVAAALDGVSAAFFHLPMPTDMEQPAKWFANFFAAAERVSLPLVVYTTGGPSGARYASSMSVDYATAGMNSVFNSGIPAIVLQPTFYLENLQPDLFVPNLHSKGLLDYPPVPETLKVQWVSHVDQGKIAAAALGRPDFAGQAFEIGSQPALTGAELAKHLESWVGRSVRFAPASPLAFGQRVEDALNAPGTAASMDDLYGTVAKLEKDEMAIDIAGLENTFDVKLTPIADQIANWPKR